MSQNSNIEWLRGSKGMEKGATWNPVRARNRKTGKVGWFCTKPSPGCKGCYAERMNKGMFGNGIAYAIDKMGQVEIFLDEKTLLQPLHWKKGRLIFPCSMTDWQADFVPDEFRDKMLAVMALTPQHTYLTLTKRADRQRKYLSDPGLMIRMGFWASWAIHQRDGGDGSRAAKIAKFLEPKFPLPNHWLGVSAENQEYADKRIPELLQTPAAVRWVSAEPLLGELNLGTFLRCNCGVDPQDDQFAPPWGHAAACPYRARLGWVVCGGESGPGARPMQEEWARRLMQQCEVAGVPFFMKQGAKANWPDFKNFESFPQDLQVRQYPEAAK